MFEKLALAFLAFVALLVALHKGENLKQHETGFRKLTGLGWLKVTVGLFTLVFATLVAIHERRQQELVRDIDGLLATAWNLCEDGKLKNALNLFDLAISQDRSNSLAWRQKGFCYLTVLRGQVVNIRPDMDFRILARTVAEEFERDSLNLAYASAEKALQTSKTDYESAQANILHAFVLISDRCLCETGIGRYAMPACGGRGHPSTYFNEANRLIGKLSLERPPMSDGEKAGRMFTSWTVDKGLNYLASLKCNSRLRADLNIKEIDK